jgi:hypothetical protein
MTDKKPIKLILADISKDISELETEKNLGKIIKQYNKINTDIKNTSSKIYSLKQKFDEEIVSNTTDIDQITEEQYEQFSKELSGEDVNKILSLEDLDTQIDEYKKLLKKINSCKNYLESKKMKIIECDTDMTCTDNVVKNEVKKLGQKTNLKKKKKQNISSSESATTRSSSSSSASSSSSNSSESPEQKKPTKNKKT